VADTLHDDSRDGMAAQPPAAAPVNYDQFVRKLAFPRPLSFLLCTALLASVFFVAVRIRLFAVITYGRIIHEFDPWFNYRATEYMVEHGYAKFEAWYDDKVWYPLGRHVGSTTYPGLQLTAYALHELLKHVHPMSVNDVCVLMPAAFGGVASLLCGALAYEVTFSRAAAICAAAFMAVLASLHARPPPCSPRAAPRAPARTPAPTAAARQPPPRAGDPCAPDALGRGRLRQRVHRCHRPVRRFRLGPGHDH